MPLRAIRKFSINKLREPLEAEMDSDVEWVCGSLGFITPRDKDMTAYKILKMLIEAAKRGEGLTCEELTTGVDKTTGAVSYHLNRLMKANLIVKQGSSYQLRMSNLEDTVEEIEKDIHLVFERVRKISRDVDDSLGIVRKRRK